MNPDSHYSSQECLALSCAAEQPTGNGFFGFVHIFLTLVSVEFTSVKCLLCSAGTVWDISDGPGFSVAQKYR